MTYDGQDAQAWLRSLDVGRELTSGGRLPMKLVNRNEVVTSGSLVGTRNASPAGLAADEVVVALVRERVGHYGWSCGRKKK